MTDTGNREVEIRSDSGEVYTAVLDDSVAALEGIWRMELAGREYRVTRTFLRLLGDVVDKYDTESC